MLPTKTMSTPAAATTISPYGGKCNGIHDPCIALTAKEKELIKIKSIQFCAADATTDVNVDYLRISKILEVNYGPFGSATSMMLATFDAFQDIVCGKGDMLDNENSKNNMTSYSTIQVPNNSMISTMNTAANVAALLHGGKVLNRTITAGAGLLRNLKITKMIQRLEIALAFYKSRNFECFKFKASHIVYKDFACMLVQKKYFYLNQQQHNNDDHNVIATSANYPAAAVHEISKDEYIKGKVMGKHVVVVHELAFDQEAKKGGSYFSSKPAPALWFNISECDIKQASVKDITDIAHAEKELKRKGGKKDFYGTYLLCCSNPEAPFRIMYSRLNDPCGFHNMVIDTLIYHSNMLRGNHSFCALLLLVLKQRFEGSKQAVALDKWPICQSLIDVTNTGNSNLDRNHDAMKTTDNGLTANNINSPTTRNAMNKTYDDSVPNAEHQYKLSKTSKEYFLLQSLCCNIQKIAEIRDNSRTTNGRPRLPIFVRLVGTSCGKKESGGKRSR